MSTRFKAPSVISKTVNVNSFAGGWAVNVNDKIAPISNCVNSYNFNYFDGSLKQGVVLAPLATYNAIAFSGAIAKNLYFYPYYNHETNSREDKIVAYANDGYLYVANLNGTFKKLSSVYFKTAPMAIPYDYLDSDVMLFSSPENGLVILNCETLTQCNDAPPITSLCVHNERLFVTVAGEGTSLWFSDDFNPTNWAISLDEAGFIEFADSRGKLLRVVSFLGNVYAFREYGVTRISAYGNQSEFSVDNLFCSQGKIIGSSITDCGDFIVMLTSTGFYKFNGLDAVKILSEYDGVLLGVNNENAKGVLHGTTLYYSINMVLDGRTEKVLLVYDVIKKTSYIAKGLKLKELCFAGRNVNEVLALDGISNEIYYLTDKVDNYHDKLWKSPYFDFGIRGKNKRLSSISLYTRSYVRLTVFAGEQSCVYELDGEGFFEVKPGLKGEFFAFQIETHLSNPEILSLSATIDYVKGEKNVY